jgi:NADH-quinone oxidoreductase subunit K
MIDAPALDRLVALSLLLFGLGLLGVLWRRNLLIILMSLQLMMGAGQLAFVAFGRSWAGVVDSVSRGGADGLVVGVAQIVVGLAIVIAAVQHRDSLDVEDARVMRW